MRMIRKPKSPASTRYCRIENGKITVEDIGSLNGTYVNRGQRLRRARRSISKAATKIIIGKTFLKLVVETIA